MDPSARARRDETVTFWVAEMDFATKTERLIDLDDVPAANAAGRFVWIDVDVHDPTRAREFLAPLELADGDAVEAVSAEGR